MKRVYVNEEWCLGCRLCEYNCAFAKSGMSDIVKALRGKKIFPRIRVRESDGINFAVSGRHCDDPRCMKGCITGAITKSDGVVMIDKNKCVGCFTCVLSCPYGAVVPDGDGHAADKCELCMQSTSKKPACVEGCPNRAIVFEERT